ncbi:hypothetical protein HC776_03285 [bacterium]|nr:hypothetical protein [bacterium]
MVALGGIAAPVGEQPHGRGVLDTFGTNRADIVGDIHSGGGEINQWFNTACYQVPNAAFNAANPSSER